MRLRTGVDQRLRERADSGAGFGVHDGVDPGGMVALVPGIKMELIRGYEGAGLTV